MSEALARHLNCQRCSGPIAAGYRFCPGCGAAATPSITMAPLPDPMIGRAIGDAYVIRELIGAGGMGSVYRAEQTTLGRAVAIKVLHPHLRNHDELVQRFYTEARASSALNHPNSVSIIDFGRTDEGILYLVMELLRGRDLAALVANEGPLPLERVCSIVIDVLSALDEAHASGVVHRDLKPENIFVETLRTGRSLTKVVDFGIASLARDTPRSGTLPDMLCGTPQYMSPEQVCGTEVDGRSDIYAAGIVLFELLVGRVPFSADTPTNTALCHLQEAPPDPRKAAPGRHIPGWLSDVTLRALAKEPAKRFARASAMAEALHAGLPMLGDPRASYVRTKNPEPAGSEGPAPALHFVGRDAQLEALRSLRTQAAKGRLLWARIEGEVGVGKRRLLSEATTAFREAGDRVIQLGPHDSLLAVPYWPLRMLMRELAGARDDEALKRIVKDKHASPLVDAGLRELLDPHGWPSRGLRSRVPALAHTLATLLRSAARDGRTMIITLDDAHRLDGASLRALRLACEQVTDLRLLVCVAAPESLGDAIPEHAQHIALDGLTLEQVGQARGGRGYVSRSNDKRLSPLFLEQLRFLQVGSDDTLPSDLADAVARRVQRLPPAAQRVLQAVAVLGLRTTQDAITALVGASSGSALSALTEQGLLDRRDDFVCFPHPHIRDLVEASVPAQTRHALHAKALAFATTSKQPIEVRAHHAVGAGDLLAACTLQEAIGDAARARGDHDLALLVFRQGWELARREAMQTAEPVVLGALAAMSRGLVAALVAKGDAARAEGVLRDLLELTGPSHDAHARALSDLALLAIDRGQHREAQRLLGQARELAGRLKSEPNLAAVHAACAALKHAEGDRRAEMASLLDAFALFSRLGTDRTREWDVAMKLGAAMRAAHDLVGAARALEHAERLGRHGDQLDLAAEALCARAQLERERGDKSAALSCLKASAELAALAGDLELVARAESMTRAK